MDKKSRILVTGATGFTGHALMKALKNSGYADVVGVGSREYDLLEQEEIRRMFREIKPEYMFHLTAYVGGILANREYPADFFYKNITFVTQVFHEAHASGVKKLLLPMCGCSYPGHAPNPIKEEDMWNGFPQPESAAYSIAKKTVLIQSAAYRKQYGFRSIVPIPGNMYGPFDNFSLQNSHVIPALLRKFYEAKKEGKKEVVCWGSGKPTRDFVYVDDVAEALVLAMEKYDSSEPINISSGVPVTIKELVETVSKVSGYEGELVWDKSKPDGQMEKLFSVERMGKVLGYKPGTSLEEGLKKTMKWFEENYSKGTVRL